MADTEAPRGQYIAATFICGSKTRKVAEHIGPGVSLREWVHIPIPYDL
jgi:hypothetical protein